MKGEGTVRDIIRGRIQEVLEGEEVKLKKIILFGSRARGDWETGSDWDLLVIVDKKLPRKEKIRISHILRRKLAEEFIPCDILIKSEKEANERRGVIGSVVKKLLRRALHFEE